MAVRKVVVFMRAYNDVDHLTPVVWKLSTSTDVHVTVVMRTGSEFAQDYRIDFMRTLPRVEVHHIREFLGAAAPVEGEEQIEKSAARPLSMRIRGYFRRLLGLKRTKPSVKVILEPEPIREMLATLFSGVDKGLIVFDWVSLAPGSRRFAELLCNVGREFGFGNVALPHGDSPY